MKVLAQDLPTPILHRFVNWLRGPRQPWDVTGHCSERMADWHLTLADLDQCFQYGVLIEVSHDGQHLRCLLRDSNGICIVLVPARWLIVTCWRNDPSDNHATINHGAYHRGDLPSYFLEELPGGEPTQRVVYR